METGYKTVGAEDSTFDSACGDPEARKVWDVSTHTTTKPQIISDMHYTESKSCSIPSSREATRYKSILVSKRNAVSLIHRMYE